MSTTVRQWLRRRGVTSAEVSRAERREQLHLLVVDRAAIGEAQDIPFDDAARRAGITPEQFDELWTSFGFPGNARQRRFTHMDVEEFRNLGELSRSLGITSIEVAALARVIGSATSRVAEAGLSSAAVVGAHLDSDERAERFLHNAESTFPAIARLLAYSWRRHLQAAARRGLLADCPPEEEGRVDELAVGFADLAGFTAFSHQLTPAALEQLIRRFSSIVQTVVHREGGRVVKLIGDEVMFVADDPATAVRIGLRLVNEVRADDVLSTMKVGIAAGPALAREGDYFGAAVNTASRVAGITRTGAVVVTSAVRDAVRDDAIEWRNLRHCYLRGIGWVPLWAARDPASPRRPERGPRRVVEAIEDLTRDSLERLAAIRGPVG